MNQHYEPAAFSWQSSAGTPDRSLNKSSCSSSPTLVDDEAEVHALQNSQLSEPSSRRIQVPKFELDPYAPAFVPSVSTLRLAEYGYFPPPINTNEKWLEILKDGMLIPDPRLPTRLVEGSWTFQQLCDLAKLFCWQILAKANMEDFGPQAARFAREVRDAFTNHHSEWHSSCFVSHLQMYALDHFKLYWCSHNNPNAISLRKRLEGKRWNTALNFSCFIADMFSVGLIQVPMMHECLGILLHEMVRVEHVHTVQAMVRHAGPALWQAADSSVRRHEFTTRYLERTVSLQDNANLHARQDNIWAVIQVNAILPDHFYRINTRCFLHRVMISSP
ncbi:hypothetical protein DEU56DRAFT_450450 [Suillus clintonianus]|uniref:uncharacterized protein n=1 Tax=Suillus clintonianus TaxID=1904413 RepID=UPI001B867CEA|nr:uncharacterized protein DEU56DRAFT_450450 [Suillus clintonianus]KAG2131778.1 hypothetical protein DEU56DRAFT_450450 [Suillus clintonianus]